MYLDAGITAVIMTGVLHSLASTDWTAAHTGQR